MNNTNTPTATDNELIAEFMGFELDTVWNERIARRPNANNGHMVGDMKYDTSWDWLMPVVEKIENIRDKNDQVTIARNTAMFNGGLNCFHYGKTKIEAVYQCVIQFIKWYNSTKAK